MHMIDQKQQYIGQDMSCIWYRNPQRSFEHKHR